MIDWYRLFGWIAVAVVSYGLAALIVWFVFWIF